VTRTRAIFVGILLVAFALRAFWAIGGIDEGCTRDECTYRELAERIVDGQGLRSLKGWLWAPGWPYVLAACLKLTGTVNSARIVQLAAGVATVPMLFLLGRRLGGDRAGLLAAAIYSIHPTFAWFAGTLWSEVTYTFLLVAAVWGALWAREGGFERALLPGVLIGACVLFRGVATYMAPIFALAVMWPRAGKHAATLLLGVALVVAPWSLHASRTQGGFMLSDATLGQMMWLGDNDFGPITYDWGNGLLEDRATDLWTAKGRPHCDEALPPAQWDRCEVRNGLSWIRSHPSEFVARIPLRLAQLMNPHTFATRYLRWGKMPDLAWEAKEAAVLWIALTSFGVVLGGLLGGFAKGRGPFALLAGGVVGYHLLAIAALAGLSRYRLPLEAFGIVFLALLLADPRGAVASLRASPLRAAGAAVSVAVALPLMLWFFPAGYPTW
jgi:hypothetical protein